MFCRAWSSLASVLYTPQCSGRAEKSRGPFAIMSKKRRTTTRVQVVFRRRNNFEVALLALASITRSKWNLRRLIAGTTAPTDSVAAWRTDGRMDARRILSCNSQWHSHCAGLRTDPFADSRSAAAISKIRCSGDMYCICDGMLRTRTLVCVLCFTRKFNAKSVTTNKQLQSKNAIPRMLTVAYYADCSVSRG